MNNERLKRLRELALIGLETEMAMIVKEIAEIKNELSAPQTPARPTRSSPPRRRSHMSAAKRREASQRMKRYWAERRAGKK